MVSAHAMDGLAHRLLPLVGLQFDVLRIPRFALVGIEPSQIGTIVGTLVDACIPELPNLFPARPEVGGIGLSKAPGILGEREGYPDFVHEDGLRIELKMLYVNPVGVQMKSPPTPREPSARLTQKVTVRNVVPDTDVLLLCAYQLRPLPSLPDTFAPTVIDLGLFPMIECINARDHRLKKGGGRWFGDYETPVVLSRLGRQKLADGREDLIDASQYGRKENEGYDYNEDTNFGKMKRIPYRPLQQFIRKHGAAHMRTGDYPEKWRL